MAPMAHYEIAHATRKIIHAIQKSSRNTKKIVRAIRKKLRAILRKSSRNSKKSSRNTKTKLNYFFKKYLEIPNLVTTFLTKTDQSIKLHVGLIWS